MTIIPSATWIAPLIDGERYGVLYAEEHYTVSCAALAAIIFREWGG